MSAPEEAGKKALAMGSALFHVIWEAIKAGRGDAGVVELEQLLREGKATLGIYLQRDAENIYLCAAALEPGWQDPFGARLVHIQGPMIHAVDELARVFVLKPENVN
jgi:hypothetical protein